MQIKELEKIVKDTQEMVKRISECVAQLKVCENENDYASEISCTGNIHINNGIDIDMRFDTIGINSIDNAGMDLPTEGNKTYFHFYDFESGNELQISSDDIFSVTFSDQYFEKEIVYNYDNAEDFADKLKHLEEWHGYEASIVTKLDDFEIFDIAFSINVD